ncbi:MAG: sodium-dependent transporter [Candidatus Euphemobacter frigidus]|nr:sodium-dependent transporter [Candidatus Euphemobacter frigidus]MDP8275427.1 sodium-dependent transporter [Candidatus Euphemobacter frigidus]
MVGRERWNSRSAFVMAAIGSAVGLGNIWRFPVTCYKYGGGAFFIPYFIALLTAGIPLMILEYGIGQMMQGSAPRALSRINKHTEWVGWFSLLIGLVISIYYAIIMAYAVEYLVYAVKGFFDGGQMPWSMASEGFTGTSEVTFFTETIRKHSSKASEMWQLVWPLIGGLVVTWGAVYLILCRGVRRVGRVVMWTVPLPVVVLGILAVRGLTLPGASAGIIYYLTPNFAALKDPATWLAAYGQIFFSLTLGFGVMIAYASYMPRDSDITNNAFITCFANCATSFLAGFVVFSVLGFLAYQKGGVEVSKVIAAGPGLVFITYPTAVTQMGQFGWLWPPLVGVLFFVMLLFLGIDSLFSLIEGITTGLRDRYAFLSQKFLTAAVSGLCLVVGIVFFASRAGIHWLDIFDHWANDYGLVIVGLLQCVIVGYFFKTDTLRDYINRVSEIKLWGWWELCIRIITPLVLGYLIFSNFINEMTRGTLYGASGTDFDRYLWVAPVTFIILFIIALSLARLWKFLVLIGGGVVVFFITWLILPGSAPLSTSIFCSLAASVLFGGLAFCITIARRGKESRG